MGKIYQYYAENSDAHYEKAVEWLSRSAEKNNLLGNINLGHMYEAGIGIERSIREALQRYLRAYEQGSEHAIKSFKMFMKTNFVDIHETGFKMPNEYNYESLADECEKEANENNLHALVNIAYMCHHGLGRATSLEKAIEYYKKAILKGGNIGDVSCAITQINRIRQEGNIALIDNDNAEQTLKRAAALARIRSDAEIEKKYVKEEKYGILKPNKPVYTSCWTLGRDAKEYNENDCYTQEELKLELRIYSFISERFDMYKEQWEKAQAAKLSELDNKIKEVTAELEELESCIECVSYSEHTRLDALAFAYDYCEQTGATIEEGIFEYRKTQSFTVGTVEENKVVISECNELSVVKPVTEVLRNLSEIEGKIIQLKRDDEKLKKCIFGINKPVKPAYRAVLHKDAPSAVYKGRICETEQAYVDKMQLFYMELEKYYSERLQLLDTQPNKRMTIQKQIAKLRNEACHLYAKMDFPAEYENQEALDFIRNHIEKSQCTLQVAYKEYENHKKKEKQKAERELEIKQNREAEQERIRIENAKRRMEQWDREYEEQERERERVYDEKYGKKDLLGSTVCLKRFQTGPFDVKHSCAFCPQARNCTRA